MSLLETRINLKGPEVREIVRWISYYYSHDDIVEMTREKFGKKLSKQLISHYKNSPKYQSLIEADRREYEASVADVELASKRKRIERLQTYAEKLENQNNIPAAISALKAIREEREGNINSINITQFNRYENMQDHEIVKIVKESSDQLERLQKRRLTVGTDLEVADQPVEEEKNGDS